MSVDLEVGQAILKPAGGLMDALMSPKIARVRKWANERDLGGQLQSEPLEKLMRSYLDGLAKRVSEITSMAFPHEKLDIFKVYEPLYLKKYRDNEPVDITEKLRTGQLNVTIIDDAGMGKSTYSKHLVTELLGKSEYIPILYDLRKIKAGDELVEVLAKELDAPGALISRDVFYRLLQLGQFVLILDGFDEVSLSLQSEVADQINQISYKASENSIVLTTRPQNGLPDLVGGKTVEFLELTRKQAESLIRRYDTVRGGEVGEKLIEQLHTVPEEFLKTPLLVTLMYQTFLTKGYIATDVSRFYNSVFDALYDGHDLNNKNNYTREKESGLSSYDFRSVLRLICFRMIALGFGSFANKIQAISFFSESISGSMYKEVSAELLYNDFTISVPLMQKEGEEIKFIHRTIFEFFAAEYIVYKSDKSDLIKKIISKGAADQFSDTFVFLRSIDFEAYRSCFAVSLLENYKHPKGPSVIEEFASSVSFICDASIAMIKVSDYGDLDDLKKYNVRKSFRHAPISEFYNASSYPMFKKTIVKANGEYYYFLLASKQALHKIIMLFTESLVDSSSHFESLGLDFRLEKKNSQCQDVSDFLDKIESDKLVALDYELLILMLNTNCKSHIFSLAYGIFFDDSNKFNLISSSRVRDLVDSTYSESKIMDDLF